MTTPIRADHAQHDLELVAAHAARDLDPAGVRRAAALIASCAACRELSEDLAVLAVAVRTLPQVTRDRDFRISAETAARLRPTSAVRRLVEALLAPTRLGRSVAGAMMTLGLAGLLVASLPTWLPGGVGIFTAGAGGVLAPVSGGPINADGGAPEFAGPSAAPDGAQKDGFTTSGGRGGSQAPDARPEPAPSAAPPAGPAGAVASPGGDQGTPPTDSSTGGAEADDGRLVGGASIAWMVAILSGLLLAAGVILLVLRRVAPAGWRRSGG